MSLFDKDDDRTISQKLFDDVRRCEKIEEFVYEEADYLNYVREQEKKKEFQKRYESEKKEEEESTVQPSNAEPDIQSDPDEEFAEDDYYSDLEEVISTQEAEIDDLKQQLADLKAQIAGKQPEAKKDGCTPNLALGVNITLPDGKTVQRVAHNIFNNSDYCLVSPGGKTYHTLAGCFLYWPEEYQKNFNGWQLITVQEAKERGLRLCNFCDEQNKLKSRIDKEPELFEEELIAALKRNHSFEEYRLTKSFSSEAQEAIDCLSVGDEVSFEEDEDFHLLVKDSCDEVIGCVPDSIKDRMEEKMEDTTEMVEFLTSYVSEIEETSSGKKSVKILTITEDSLNSLIFVDFDGTGIVEKG